MPVKYPDPDRVGHGTRYCYQQHRCRCDLCREANTQQYREARERKRQGIKLETPVRERKERQHGTYQKYREDRCRCEACTEANKIYTRDYRARKAAGEIEEKPFQFNPVAGSVRSVDLEPENGWLDHARCLVEADIAPDFFPEGNDSTKVTKARKFCEGCVTREMCLEWSLTATVVSAEGDSETYVEGILGGVTTHERRRIRAERGIKKKNRGPSK